MAKLLFYRLAEEGEDYVKSLWPVQIGLDMHYNEVYR